MTESEHKALENIKIRINSAHVKLLTCQNSINTFLSAEKSNPEKRRTAHFIYAPGLWGDLFKEIVHLNCLMKSSLQSLHEAELIDAEIKKEIEQSIDRFHKLINPAGSNFLSNQLEWFQKGAVDVTPYKNAAHKLESALGATINDIGFCEQSANRILHELAEIREFADKQITQLSALERMRWNTLNRRTHNISRAIEKEVKSALHEFKIAINQLIAAKGWMEKFMQKEDIFGKDLEKSLGSSSNTIKFRREYGLKLLELKKRELQAL